MSTKILLSFIIILTVSCGRHKPVHKDKDEREILALHKLQRDFHFTRDSVAFANQLSDDFISVNKGQITRPERKETISRYHQYFSSVEFVKWDDVTEPIIRFSDDGKLAYTIVDKIVNVNYEDENGMIIDGETHFAWTSIYRKYDVGWKIECVTSTNKPIASE